VFEVQTIMYQLHLILIIMMVQELDLITDLLFLIGLNQMKLVDFVKL
jgi:hypothetical protein